MKRVSAKLKKAVRGEQPEPQMRQVIGHLLQLLGGERALAKILADEWHAAKEGSLIRQRILELIMRSMWRVNEKSSASMDDLGVLTEEDLEREVSMRVAKFDGEESTTTDGAEATGGAAANTAS